ncbi:MAG: ABC transporter ATP-binding protein [Spirochaetae bacterium HGW-Spirochaetae-7]|jgi:putative multiple sugar transport system ATP-binding protein|nr:MAG: ABC transporter ATP-binding protein [Spirochaetae bacterium HGW-Spirochaetae-7]
MIAPILEMRNITKTFPGVRALSEVSFSVAKGEIHCLVGENGAGKSTLMKVLSGVYPHGDYSGDILLEAQSQKFRNIADSEHAGIGIIYQELALVPDMTVYDNILLGHELKSGLTVNLNETIKQATEMLAKVRLQLNPSTKVRDLGVGKQQLVEIAKALCRDIKILILDEPTAALNEDDCDNLLDILRGLKRDGVTSIMISHKLKEVIHIADTVTVLRDGQTVCTLDASRGEVSEGVLIKHMVGREIDDVFPKRKKKISDEVVMQVRDWTVYSHGLGRTLLSDVNFDVHKGEIVGFAGLMGSGRTELAHSLFGNPDGYRLNGEIKIEGKVSKFTEPRNAIDAGIAYASEDRKKNGLILIQDVKQNVTLANLKALATRGVVDANGEAKVAEEYRTALSIKTPSINQKVLNLSGGNQQKVSIAKWLFVKPKLLILDEPTRGIDVGAKYEIYTLMNKLVDQGMSIIMISSELPEILGMSDRIYIVSSGRITGELPIAEATQEKIMQLATS